MSSRPSARLYPLFSLCKRSVAFRVPRTLAELPLTVPLLATITQQTQAQFSGGFFWEVFKQPKPGMNEATPTQVAQAVCNVVLPGSPRCAGTLPVWPN